MELGRGLLAGRCLQGFRPGTDELCDSGESSQLPCGESAYSAGGMMILDLQELGGKWNEITDAPA